MEKTTETAPESRPSPQSTAIGVCRDRLNTAAPLLSEIGLRLKEALPSFIAEAPIGEALDDYKRLESAISSVEDAVKELSRLTSLAREVLIPERFDNEQASTINTDFLRATRTVRTFASIVSEKVDVAYQWLRDNGHGSLIKETVSASSLSALAKELMSKGFELPEDVFSVHMKNGVSITLKKK